MNLEGKKDHYELVEKFLILRHKMAFTEHSVKNKSILNELVA